MSRGRDNVHPTDKGNAPAALARAERRILVLRGEPVLLDIDLAELYHVPVKQLNQAVRRNRERFPADFVFQLTADEWSALRSQSVTSNSGRGGRRYAPYAFTKHGAVMVATVLNSARAVALSVLVVRAFIRLRGLVASHDSLARRLDELERRYDGQFDVVFQAIREILSPPVDAPRKRIGFAEGP